MLSMTINELLPSYKMSLEFIRTHVLPEIRKNDFFVLHQFSPSLLSLVSKVLFIYELEKETEDIEEIVQTLIIKIFNDLKNV